MKRILFVFNTKASFVELDIALLRQRYEVEAVYISERSPRLLLEMWQSTRNIDLVVAWFASWHGLPAFAAAAIRGIPRLVIISGYDIAKEPEIGYGLQLGGLPKIISNWVLRLATYALPVSQSANLEAQTNTSISANKMRVILHGVPDQPEYTTSIKKERLALTIGTLDALSIRRKGIDTFVKAAHYLPDVPFIVVGKGKDQTIDQLRQVASDNVQFTGFMPDKELVALQQRAKVYVQPSIHEGFGMAVAESMLARCIPVVSKRGALPEVVGDTGLYTETNPAAVAKAIQQALDMDDDFGAKARQRILTLFPIEKRAEQLYALIDGLLDKRSEHRTLTNG